MAKEIISLKDFVQQQKLSKITEIFGEDCLNDDGTLLSMSDQAAVITHYLKLKGTPFESTYKQKALAYMNAWKKGVERNLFKI